MSILQFGQKMGIYTFPGSARLRRPRWWSTASPQPEVQQLLQRLFKITQTINFLGINQPDEEVHLERPQTQRSAKGTWHQIRPQYQIRGKAEGTATNPKKTQRAATTSYWQEMSNGKDHTDHKHFGYQSAG